MLNADGVKFVSGPPASQRGVPKYQAGSDDAARSQTASAQLVRLRRLRAEDPLATVRCPDCTDKFRTLHGMNNHRARMHASSGKKFCTGCGLEKPFSDFYMRGSSPRSQCKSCDHITNYGTPEASQRRVNINYVNDKCRRHGLTREEFLEMVERSEGLCEICKREPAEENLSFDHCHSCGKPRGFLCRWCNAGLGNFRDSSAWLRAAADYIDDRDSCGGGGPNYDGGVASWSSRIKQRNRRASEGTCVGSVQ